jgi:hypothetical protein
LSDLRTEWPADFSGLRDPATRASFLTGRHPWQREQAGVTRPLARQPEDYLRRTGDACVLHGGEVWETAAGERAVE